MWRDLLGVEQVGLQDGFFALGGHSLVAVRLFARVKKTWGVDLPLATLFAAPTLEALAARVREPLGLALDTSIPGAVGARLAAREDRLVAPRPDPQGRLAAAVLLRARRRREPARLPRPRGEARARATRLRPRGPRRRRPPAAGGEHRGDGGHRPGGHPRRAAARPVPPRRLLRGRRRGPRDGPEADGGGKRVSQVVLLDTFHPATEARKTALRDHLGGLAAEGHRLSARRARARAARTPVQMPQEPRLRYYLSRGRPLPHDLRDAHLTRHFLEISRRHVPGPYAGRVTLFRAWRDGPHLRAHGAAPRLGAGAPAPPRGCGSAGKPR